MELEFRRDFEEVQQRWDAFWRGELVRRPLVSIVVPREGVTPVSKPAWFAGRDGNFEPVIDQLLAWAGTHEFFGEAIPFHQMEVGPNHFNTLLGADMIYNPDSDDTGWVLPYVDDWDHADIRFRPDGKWWRLTRDFIRAVRRRCDGKLLLAAPTLVANLDALSAMRGPERLAMDMVECPEKVHAALRAVTAAFRDVLQALAQELDYAAWGSINRHGMYKRGAINVPQCDFSCMISPAMFREFAVPYLRQEAQAYGAAEYHLDGPDAVKHLEAVCEIKEIEVIQWVPGAGMPETMDWSGLYRRIDELGKGQIMWTGGDVNYMQNAWRQYRSRKLFFSCPAATPAEAREIIRRLKNE